MENENKPLAVDDGVSSAVEPKVEEQPKEEANKNAETPKTYTQAEVDELLKGKFSQEQVNEIIEKRLNREKGKAQPETENNEELNKVKEELVKANNKIVEYEHTNELNRHNVKDDYKDFVDFKVKSMVSETKDYATALNEFLNDDGKKYVEFGNTVEMPRPKNTDTVDVEASAIEKMKRAMGLK